MSAIFDVNETQLIAVIEEFTKLSINLSTGIRPPVVSQMNNISGLAEARTHFITHRLQHAWFVKDQQRADGVTVQLLNETEYAQEEFDRPGVKASVGTPHDVRPELADIANLTMEATVFNAIVKGLRQ